MALQLKFNVDNKASPEIKKLQADLNKLKPSIDGAGSSALSLNSSLAKLAVGYISLSGAMNITKSLIKQADAMSSVNSRLKLVTKSTEEFTKVQTALFAVSQTTRQSLEETTNLYTRMARASKSLGTSQADLVKVTNSINQALVVSGASTQEAQSTITQLGQGLASGVLRGEEFNSIMENGSRIAQALSDNLGVTTGELRQMSQDGALTADVVMEALINQSSKINAEFSKMPITISQTGTVIENAMAQAVGSMDKASGSSKALSDTMLTAFYGASTVVIELANAFESLGARIAGAAFRIENGIILTDAESEALERMYQETKNNIAEREKYLETMKENLGLGEKSIDVVKREIAELEKLKSTTSDLLKVKKTTVQDATGGKQGKQQDAQVKRYYEIIEARNELEKAGAEFAMQLAEEKAQLEADFAKDMQDNYMSMLDSQIALAESTNDWNNGLTGVAGNLADVSKAMNKFRVDELKAIKAQAKLDDKYEKQKKKYAGDDEKIQEIQKQYTKDTAKIKDQARQNELQGYSQLAGAMGAFFEEGTAGAQALTAVQATLGIASGITGIMNAWSSAPFPFNMPAVAASTAAILPSIATLTSLGGQGGSGGGSGATAVSIGQIRQDTADANIQDIDAQYEPITDRLDRQISLLEVISFAGTASKATIGLASVQFEQDYKTAVENAIAKINPAQLGSPYDIYETKFTYFDGWTTELVRVADDFSKSLVEAFGDEIINDTSGTFSLFTTGFNLNPSALRDGMDMLQFLGMIQDEVSRLENDVSTGNAFIDWLNSLGNIFSSMEDYENAVNDMQEAIGDYAMTMTDVVSEMANASDDFKDIYDDITGTTTYADAELKKAFAEFDAIRGDTSYADYLVAQITAIDAVEASMSKSITDLLLSTDPADMTAQYEAITALNEATGLAFEGGVEDALNYLESIQLVGEALADEQKTIDDAVSNFTKNMSSMADSIDATIATIKGNIDSDSGMLTTEQIKRLNYTQMAFETSLATGDSDKARELLSEINSLTTNISSSAFGDTANLNANLLTSLEANKALVDLKDEVLMVRIVGSDLDYQQTTQTTTPSVYVTNSTDNTDRIANLEAIMYEVLKTNKNVYDILERIQNEGIKTI